MTQTLAQMIAAARSTVRELEPADAGDRLERGEFDLLLDVREPGEFAESHLPGALNVPRGLLEIRADPASPATEPALSANPDARILVYCLKAPSPRSLLAAQTLTAMGYANVAALGGGLNAWAEAGLPVEHAPS